MKTKIFRASFFVAMLVCLSCITIFMGVLQEYFGKAQEKMLKSELALAVTGVEQTGLSYLENHEMRGRDDERLTLIKPDGSVIFDSRAEAKKLENHGDREEVQEALKNGEGASSRYSTTFTEKTIYFASRLSSGNVLRISASRLTMLSLLLGMGQPICIIIMIALILSGVLAYGIAGSISKPLNRLDLERPLENDTYDEIAPLLTKIEQGRREIVRRKEALKEKEKEFDAVIRNMDEGLILMNRNHEIISLNPAAQEYYNTDFNAIGNSFLTLDRTGGTGKLLEIAENKGSAEMTCKHQGREYQIHASRIQSEDQFLGIVLLIFDVTDRAYAERNRKEFTANVSHELKSPLHSIMGSAELLEQEMVDQEDIPAFAGTIRKEAARLVCMIDDIIRLSALDERIELPSEELELKSFTEEVINPLRGFAEKRQITIAIEGAEVHCCAAKGLMNEIIYNLCDNAIKYNRDGGSVTVILDETVDLAVIEISDTGIGIPEEHQKRIFERFYRVDQSHSRESGGTGLGMSIVKHAVKNLNGTISLKSTVGKGTMITVKIPKAM